MSRIADVLKELNALGAVGAVETSNPPPSPQKVETLETVPEEPPVMESSDDSYWVDITAPVEASLPDEDRTVEAPATPPRADSVAGVDAIKVRVERAIAELEVILKQLDTLK